MSTLFPPSIATAALTEHVALRFGATFAANLARAVLSCLTGLLVARALGAAAYGDLSFLLASFAAASQVLEMGTSSAFYTRSCRAAHAGGRSLSSISHGSRCSSCCRCSPSA